MQVTFSPSGWESRTGWGWRLTGDRRRGWWRLENLSHNVAETLQPGYTLPMGQLTDAITKAVKASEESPCAIAKGAGIARSQLSRMIRGASGMNAESIEKLARYLELAITIEPMHKNPSKRK